LEGDDDSQRIPEDASNRGQWYEAGEAVDVPESLEFGHPRIMTSFPRPRNCKPAWKYRAFQTSGVKIHPHDFTKSLLRKV
jgi:hypothetical protein